MDSADVRAQLDHPVIDADGHVQEYLPAALPHLREALGPKHFETYVSEGPLGAILGSGDPTERARRGLPQSAWWATPAANTRDLATATFPALFVERMGELGIDYAFLYPSKAMGSAGPTDPEMRQGLCRGWNDFYADHYGPYSRHLSVGGIIPMHTPDEAIAELEHCKTIGLKAIVIPEGVYRPFEEKSEGHFSPFLMPDQTHWFDTFGLDSPHDYDPVWEAVQRLGFALNTHGGMGQMAPNNFTSTTNYSFNHIGALAEKMHRQIKSLFMSGVSRRHPNMPIAALECGVAWAVTLLNDMCEHWEKRHPEGLAGLDPATIDWDLYASLAREYGTDLVVADRDLDADLHAVPAIGSPPVEHDDWRFLGVQSEQELVDSFVDNFYFGCEADDRTLVFAFHEANAKGAELRPIFSSDIGHWDVTDMAGTLGEAWELVEDGFLTEDQFRKFVHDNARRMFTATDPTFFDGTVLEDSSGVSRR